MFLDLTDFSRRRDRHLRGLCPGDSFRRRQTGRRRRHAGGPHRHGRDHRGALFVGGSTSLPGIITSMTTAAEGYAGLAIGNAVGGLTAQTAFLAVADLAYRRANLEHAAASVTGLVQGTLLVTMLTIPLLAMASPEITIVGVHPASILLFVMYGFGLKLLSQVKAEPMWSPVMTDYTQNEAEEAEEGGDRRATSRLWRLFAVYAAITAVAGYVIGEASIALVGLTGLSETAVGTVFTAVSNSCRNW